MRNSWLPVNAELLSRLERNANCLPSRVQVGDVSLRSPVTVMRRELGTPLARETRWMSLCDLAVCQSGVVTVCRSHLPSGLGAGDPNDRCCCMSRNVIGRSALPAG